MLQKLRIHMPRPLTLIFRSDKSHQLAVVAARRGISTKNPRCVQVEKDDAEGRGTFHISGNSPIAEAFCSFSVGSQTRMRASVRARRVAKFCARPNK